MIRRKAARLVRERLREYPAVALVGPRQAGKTTLAKSFRGKYFDLEQSAERLKLDLRWDALAGGRQLVILDEAQSWPEAFPRLRGAIDAQRGRNGRFLILGSVSPALMTHVSESLAGRLSIVELTPFLAEELPGVPLDSLWLRGGYPDGGILRPKRFPQWQRDHLDLMVQRDLPNWGLPARPQVTQRLVRMLAAVHGQIWNASQIGQSLGLTYPTVNTYTDYLAGTFLVRRLPAYRANLRKRLIKSPKLYWRDTGLLHALLLVSNEDDLLDRPWVGASWEGFVVEQILGSLLESGRHVEPYFLRTSDGHEIDLVLDFGAGLWAIEIKLTANPSPADFERLEKTAALIGAERRVLVSRNTESYARGKRVSCNLPWFLRYLRRTKST